MVRSSSTWMLHPTWWDVYHSKIQDSSRVSLWCMCPNHPTPIQTELLSFPTFHPNQCVQLTFQRAQHTFLRLPKPSLKTSSLWLCAIFTDALGGGYYRRMHKGALIPSTSTPDRDIIEGWLPLPHPNLGQKWAEVTQDVMAGAPRLWRSCLVPSGENRRLWNVPEPSTGF